MPKKNYALLFLPFFLFGCAGAGEKWIEFSEETPAIILAVGDSLTEGFGVEKTQNYPAKLQQKIDEKSLPFRVVNAGISGETSGELLARIDKVLRKWDPQIVILNIGANDALRAQDLAQTKQNIEQIIEKISAENSVLILAGMKIWNPGRPEYASEFAQIYAELSTRAEVGGFIPFFLDGVALKLWLNLPDRMHPNAAGYQKIVDKNIWPVLEPILQK